VSEQPIGPLLDALGVVIELEDNHQLTEAVVLAKAVNFDSDSPPALVLASSAGLDWISMGGLIFAAQRVLDQSDLESDE
jgi:hypothetical protein